MTPIKMLIAFGRKLESLGDDDISDVIETDEELQVMVVMFIRLGEIMRDNGFLSANIPEQLEHIDYEAKLEAAVEKYLPQ
jgi:hypothetical protein